MAASRIEIAVVGAHLRGQPLNGQLTNRGAEFVRAGHTAPTYRLLALPTDPPKPGLVRGADGEAGLGAIEVEIWSLARAAFADFVDEIPAPLTIGRVRLDDGSDVAGFLCEPVAMADAPDITRFGGWRAYRAASADPPRPPADHRPLPGR
jgi:allophanate hydrolase